MPSSSRIQGGVLLSLSPPPRLPTSLPPTLSLSPSLSLSLSLSLSHSVRSVFANRETWIRVSVQTNRSNSHERPSIGGTRALIAFEVKYKSIVAAHAAHRLAVWQSVKILPIPQKRSAPFVRYVTSYRLWIRCSVCSSCPFERLVYDKWQRLDERTCA